MYWTKRQEKLQEEVDDYVDELANEFDLEIPYYPEVCWLGSGGEYTDFRLPKRFESLLEDMGPSYPSMYVKPQLIFLTSDSTKGGIKEEATHFLHQVNSKTKIWGRDYRDIRFAGMIEEMLGFFGSLVLGGGKENEYTDWPDMYTEKERFNEFMKKNREEIREDPTFYASAIIHQQGYCLGERLFYAYELNQIKKEEIQEIFKTNMNEAGVALELFTEMRERFWPIDNLES